MNEFIIKLRNIRKNNAVEPIENKRIYDSNRLNVVENKTNGQIAIYAIDLLKEKQSNTTKVKLTNIGDEKDIIEYILLNLPNGRVRFNGFINSDKNNYKLYGFNDIWYKIYGIKIDRKTTFSKEELLIVEKEIKEKIKERKYSCIYAIKYKDSFKGGREFQGPKYFGSYSIEDGLNEEFESIDSNMIVKANKQAGTLVFWLNGNEIYSNKSVKYGTVKPDITLSEEEPFEIELIDVKGINHIYDKMGFTFDACKQIIKDYAKSKEEER